MNTKNFNDILSENKDKISDFFPVSHNLHPIGDTLDYDDIREKILIVSFGMAKLTTIDSTGTESVIQYFFKDSVISSSVMNYDGSLTYILKFEEPSEIISFSAENLSEFPEKYTKLHNEILSSLMYGFHSTMLSRNVHTAVSSCRTIRSKLSEYFLHLSISNDSESFKIPISMSELANYLCVDRSAMLRELSKMQKDGLITSKNRGITILKQL